MRSFPCPLLLFPPHSLKAFICMQRGPPLPAMMPCIKFHFFFEMWRIVKDQTIQCIRAFARYNELDLEQYRSDKKKKLSLASRRRIIERKVLGICTSVPDIPTSIVDPVARFITNELINHQTFIKVIAFKNIYLFIYLCVLVFCLHVYICTMCMPGTHRCQKWYWNHEAEVTNGCELTCGFWKLNAGATSTFNHSSSWRKTLLLLCVHYTYCVFPFCHIFIAPLCVD